MFKFTRMLVVPDKKKAAKKGYVKHKDKNYYINYKNGFANWKNRTKPEWYM